MLRGSAQCKNLYFQFGGCVGELRSQLGAEASLRVLRCSRRTYNDTLICRV